MKLNPRSFLLFCLLAQSLLYLSQAVSCEAGSYAENDICLPCGDGKSSPEGAMSINECQPCADKGCKTCTGVTLNACQVCDLDYYLYNGACISSSGGTPATPYTCADKGCKECFGGNAGQCTSCDIDYYLYNGGCVSSSSGSNGTSFTCADKGCLECSGNNSGQCSSCDVGYYLYNGRCISSSDGSPATPYTCADKGCLECFGNNPGQCSSCDVGYYLDNNQCSSCGEGKSTAKSSTSIDACSPCDDYPNCQICTGLGQGQCVSCQNGFSLIDGSCESSELKCEDSDCLQCSGPGTGKCVQCKGTSALINGQCVICPSGKYLEGLSCLNCDDENCELCSGRGTGQCFSCEANYYLSHHECTSCGDGKFSLAGSLNPSDCSDCEDSNCASCGGSGLEKCSTCKNGYYLTENNTCTTCEDENCAACDGANIGRCISCLPGFELISGTCQLPGESIETSNVVSASIRYDMTMTQFNKEGGKNYFIAKLSQVLNVAIKQVTVISVRKGSVIVDYEVGTSGDKSDAENMKKVMDKAVPAGQMNFYSGKKVLNYNSQIGERDNGSDDMKSSKVGIIVGTVVGAVCIVAVILVSKKVMMMKAKKALSVEKNHQRIAPYEDSIEKTFKTEI